MPSLYSELYPVVYGEGGSVIGPVVVDTKPRSSWGGSISDLVFSGSNCKIEFTYFTGDTPTVPAQSGKVRFFHLGRDRKFELC